MEMEKQLNALMALILSCVLFGALGIQFFKHETPCPLCLMQRLGMLGVAVGALMNVKFGPKRAHYALSLLSAIYGGFVALRHIALHVCPGTTPFGMPFWGLSLYTWSFIVFCCSVAYIGILNLIFDRKSSVAVQSSMPVLGKVAFLLIFAVSFINIGTVFYQCGIGLC